MKYVKWLLVVLIMASCSVRFTPVGNPAIQSQVDRGLNMTHQFYDNRAASPGNNYSQFIGGYQSINLVMDSIISVDSGRLKGGVVLGLIKGLKARFNSYENEDKLNGLNGAESIILQDYMDEGWTNIKNAEDHYK